MAVRERKSKKINLVKIVQGAETPCISHSSMASHLQAPIRRTAKYLSIPDTKVLFFSNPTKN
jgi:hypothetical protein